MRDDRPSLRVVEGGNRPRPRLSHALELTALGVGLVLAATLLATSPPWAQQLGRFQLLFAAAFVFYGLAVLGRDRYAAIPHAAGVMLAVALAARAVLVPVPPSLSDDIYRYVWEGRVLVAGENPYRVAPDDPALVPLRDRDIWPNVNHPELSTIYPPLAEAGFALVARLSPTVIAFKLWVVLHEVALILLLMWLLRAQGAPAFAAIAYAWNPLMLVEFAGTGHHDPTGMVWLVAAFVFARARPSLSALSLVVGGLVKLAPFVALPFLWRTWTTRARVMGAALGTLGLASFLVLTRAPASGLDAYWTRWRNNDLLFYYFENWLGTFDSARLATGVVLGILVLVLLRRADPPLDATRLTLRAATLLSPVVHPWYLGWSMLFEPFRPSAPWLVLSCTAILSYGLFRTPAEGSGFHLSLGWRWLEYGIPLALAITLVLWRRRAQRGKTWKAPRRPRGDA